MPAVPSPAAFPCANHSADEGAAVAERIRSAVEAVEIESINRDVTASLGVASFPDTTAVREDLIGWADSALYQSKELGRNRVTRAEKPTPGTRPTRVQRARGQAGALDIRVQLDQGSRDRYLTNVENHTEAELLVERVSIEQDGIALMEPVRPQAGDDWKVAPFLRRHIGWRPQRNPGDSLVGLHPNEGIQFSSVIEIVLVINSNGTRCEHRQKLAVRVLVTNGQLKQLTG
jgi:hypothetical protein